MIILTPEQLSKIIARTVLSLADNKGYQIQLSRKDSRGEAEK
jgi:hypothetical protein